MEIKAGMVFGHLTTTENILMKERNKKSSEGYIKRDKWREVVCECGKKLFKNQADLTHKKEKVCSASCIFSVRRKHNHTRKSYMSPEYKSWVNIKKYCYQKTDNSYPTYGALGIIVCDEWKNNFKNFYEDMGKRPQGTCLYRYDPSDDFYKKNCYWGVKGTRTQVT